MFTGIVEEIGTISNLKRGVHSATLTIKAKKILEDIHIGDSICVNGVCLTATSYTPTTFCADIMHETLNRSSFQTLSIGDSVNLERAMSANGRFGGHFVSGHIDCIGRISSVQKDDNAVVYAVEPSKNISRFIVEKGSIAIDGISLTITKVTDSTLSISAIPHTIRETVLSQKRIGDMVNLEVDVIGQFVEKLLYPDRHQASSEQSSSITLSFLRENGF